MDADARIRGLESQIEKLKYIVHELADGMEEGFTTKLTAIEESITNFEKRISIMELKTDEIIKIQAHQGKAIKKQEEKLKHSLKVIADAFSALAIPSTTDSTFNNSAPSPPSTNDFHTRFQ